MKHNYKRSLVAAAVVAACSATAQADIGISGNIELDTSAIKTDQTDTVFDQGGRLELNMTGEHKSGANFVRGKASGIFGKSGSASTDDMWFMLGGSGWDVQLGRWEAIDLFPKGKDTLILYADDTTATNRVQVYEANLARGRISGASGQIGFHFSPSNRVSVGVDTVYGDQAYGGAGEETFGGIRPYVTIKPSGMVSVTVGGEKIESSTVTGAEVQDKTGLAVTANLKVGGFDINVNAASLKDESGTADTEVLTLGANFQSDFGLGGGLIASEADYASGADPKVTLLYLTYTVPFFGIKNATGTFAVSTSTADDVEVGTDDSKSGLRFRVNYTF